MAYTHNGTTLYGDSTHEDLLAALGYANSKQAENDEQRQAYRDLIKQINANKDDRGEYILGSKGRQWLGVPSMSGEGEIPRYSSHYDTKPNNSPYHQPMSIMDAYYAGKFGERGSDEARRNKNYFIADSIAKYLRNTGKDIGNVGAQYSGGTINNDYETSAWADRNNELMKQGISAEAKGIGGSDAAMNAAGKEADIMAQYKNLSSKELALQLDSYKLALPRQYMKLISSADSIGGPLGAAIKGAGLVMMDKAVNGGTVGTADLIGAISASGGEELVDWMKENGVHDLSDLIVYLASSPSSSGGSKASTTLTPSGGNIKQIEEEAPKVKEKGVGAYLKEGLENSTAKKLWNKLWGNK